MLRIRKRKFKRKSTSSYLRRTTKRNKLTDPYSKYSTLPLNDAKIPSRRFPAEWILTFGFSISDGQVESFARKLQPYTTISRFPDLRIIALHAFSYARTYNGSMCIAPRLQWPDRSGFSPDSLSILNKKHFTYWADMKFKHVIIVADFACPVNHTGSFFLWHFSNDLTWPRFYSVTLFCDIL